MNGVPGGQQQQPPGMPDPINALQNLASQGKIVDQYTRTQKVFTNFPTPNHTKK